MRAFDKVIGYNNIKEELKMVCDIIKHPDKYKKLGVTPPKGIILHGEAGVGKTLLANCFIEECNIKSFTCRKNLPNSDFVKTIKNTFDEAKKCTPAIILLDDIDKYSLDDDCKNTEEYITIQSCIDDVKNLEVYVIATANSVTNLPTSLIRAGRFDINIIMHTPKGQDAIDIIKHYLSKKNYVSTINATEIGKMLNGFSCAEVESVINEAGLYAGYNGKQQIEFSDFVKACVRSALLSANSITDVSSINKKSKSDLEQIAYHEAGHIVIAEILNKSSVSISSIGGDDGISGFVNVYSESSPYRSIELIENKICTLLAGRVAVEILTGNIDTGSETDMLDAYILAKSLVVEYSCYGFDKYNPLYLENQSNNKKYAQETAISNKLTTLYNKTKNIICNNVDFLKEIANVLLEKTTITQNEIVPIRAKFNI